MRFLKRLYVVWLILYWVLYTFLGIVIAAILALPAWLIFEVSLLHRWNSYSESLLEKVMDYYNDLKYFE